nr:MAG: putative maturation protein [Leviviridae sp.]
MPFRVRSRTGGDFVGSGMIGLVPISRNVPSYTHSCEDTTGPQPYLPHPLLITKAQSGTMVLNGSNGLVGVAQRSASNLPSSYGTPVATFPTLSSDLEFATHARAVRNPATAHVSIPNFLFEFKDLPGMLRRAGNSLLNRAAGDYLSLSFGWIPLISDLKKLSEFTSALERKKKQLRSLQQKGGIRTKYTANKEGETITEAGDLLIESQVATVFGQRRTTSNRKRWAVNRWQSNLDPFLMSDHKAMSDLAIQHTLGLHGSHLTINIWNGLPWSWLIDYFASVGDFLTASNNSVAYVVGDITSVMTHTRHESHVSVTANLDPWITVQELQGAIVETKKRNIVSGLSPITASLPVLSGRQLANLAAIGAKYARF